MSEEKEEGIVLSVTPFEDKHRIITVLTKESGIATFIVKGISVQKSYLFSLTSPFFCIGEFVYRKGNSNILRFIDGSIIEELAFLRKDLTHLTYACKMGKAISVSQLPQKDSS
ncbi:MAG: DNA repair protein RecO, partial [Chlamydiota bacterium]